MSEPTKFRKKPVVIEAMIFDGSWASIDAICRWANGYRSADEDPWVTYAFTNADDVQEVLIDTLEGHMNVSPGDYVLKGVQDEFYPCKPDIFAATYEPSGRVTSPQVEIQTTERAILCADGKIHFGEDEFHHNDAAYLLNLADKCGRPYMPTEALRQCGPHSYRSREHIVTAWTEANT